MLGIGAFAQVRGPYASTRIDQQGRLHIVLRSGRELLAPKARDQVGFESPAVSADGTAVGWLQDYPFPGVGPGITIRGPSQAGWPCTAADGSSLHSAPTRHSGIGDLPIADTRLPTQRDPPMAERPRLGCVRCRPGKSSRAGFQARGIRRSGRRGSTTEATRSAAQRLA
jgi:hypothetical protein